MGKARKAWTRECQVRRKGAIPRKKELGFGIRNLEWTEMKWSFNDKKGKYSEKLHPICLVYEETV